MLLTPSPSHKLSHLLGPPTPRAWRTLWTAPNRVGESQISTQISASVIISLRMANHNKANCSRDLMQFSGSLSQSVLHPNRIHDNQPIDGVNARPLLSGEQGPVINRRRSRRRRSGRRKGRPRSNDRGRWLPIPRVIQQTPADDDDRIATFCSCCCCCCCRSSNDGMCRWCRSKLRPLQLRQRSTVFRKGYKQYTFQIR